MAYTVFRIPKKSGGMRIIEAPDDTLKAAQRGDLQRLDAIYAVSVHAHAFCHTRSMATMAKVHLYDTPTPYMVGFDLKDFFPSIKWDKFLQEQRWSRRNRDRWALTESDKTNLKIHFFDFNDGKGLRLPQGAPGSPSLSNFFMFGFDNRMQGVCRRLGGLRFSRYADDIVISSSTEADHRKVWAAYEIARRMLRRMGLAVNPAKTRAMNPKRKMCVCGLVVNPYTDGRPTEPRLSRRWRRRLRAALHQQGLDLDRRTHGKLALAHMVAVQGART